MDIDFVKIIASPAGPAVAADVGAVRIEALAAEPFGANARVKARIGPQDVDGITVDQFGHSFSGYVQQLPDPNDTLSVSIDGSDMEDTGLTVTEPDPIPGPIPDNT